MTVGDITASAYAWFFVVFPIPLNQSSGGYGSGYLAEPDEINPLQWITVDFLTGQRIDYAWVAKLFPDEIKVCVRRTRRRCDEYEFLDEIGAYSADGGAQVIFTAADADGNLRLDLGSEIIESITFYVPDVHPVQQTKYSDFSLVGFSAPEPTVLALIGLGLAGFGYRRQRSTKAA